MIKNRIGVDIDAVLTDEGRGKNNIWYKKICAYFDLDCRKNYSYDFTEAYGLSETEIKNFIADKGEEIMRNIPPRPHCQKVLQEFKAKGYEIFLITARSAKDRAITVTWLTENNIPYDQLFFSDHKVAICEEEGLQLFIDDHLDNLIPIKKAGIPVLLMNMKYNQHYTGDITRVNNWLEIKTQVNKILGLN